MPTSKKKEPKKRIPKTPEKKRTDQKLSEKVLASNYFSDQQEQNKKLHKSKPKALKARKSKSGLKGFKKQTTNRLKQNITYWKRKKARKKDLKIRKQAAYLSDLPDTRLRRSLHKLHPKKIFGFIFSIRGLVFGLKFLIILGVLGASGLAAVYLHYRRDVPTSIANLQSCIEGQTTKYYDRTGKILLWASKSDFDCQPIKLNHVSRHLINALITIEDKDFYNHRGFKVEAIVRAGINNIFNERTQGGSTITQQYIKNAILQDSSRTFDRKIKEIILAIELERTFDKDEILTAYLNTISFGSIYSGVEAASQGYFNKSADELTLDEAALLVAALPAPTSFWNNPESHAAQQKWVLTQMLADKQISQEEYDEVIEIDTLAKVKISHEQYENIRAPHFVLETEKRLTEELCNLQKGEDPEENCENIRLRGYKVITTLDIKTQTLAEKTIDTVIPTIIDKGFDNAALVAVDVENGKVIAQVGSRNFKYEGFGQTNTATQQRDPGSTFKIFDYGALLENSSDWGPGSILYDYETTFNDRNWTPKNYDGRNAGPITMRRALGRSLNIPAVKAMYITGINTVHNFAYEAGIDTEFPCEGGCGLASAFGGGTEVRLDELTNAYATFSRGGIYMPLTYIDQVLDSEGKLLRQWRQKQKRVFSAETSYLLNHILADESVRYTTAYNLDPDLDTVMAIKTGTDDNYINNHVMGYSKAIAMGAWIGNHDESVTFESELNTTTPKALIIKTFMEEYHKDVAYEKRNHWSRPAGIKKVKIDLLTGYQVSKDDEENREDENQRFNRIDIFPSWYTPKISTEEDKVIEIDTVSGKIATRCTPPKALKQVKAVKIKTEISIDDPFYDNWQEPILTGLIENLGIFSYTGDRDTLHKCDDEGPSIKILSRPENCSSTCPIKIEARAGTFDLEQINIIHNNQILNEGSIPAEGRSKTITYNYDPSSVNSPPEFRGVLTIEVIDEGLYNDKTSVFLQIQGFPYPQAPPTNINLTSTVIDQSKQILKVSWNRAGYNLKLRFDGECASQTPIYLDDEAVEIEINIEDFASGECEVVIIDSNEEESDRLKFNIP